MAKHWWENDPVVESSNWWENDPVVDTPTTEQPGDWDFLSQYGQISTQPAVEEPPSRELLDYGKSALSGVVRFPESIVGLVDLFNTPHRAVFEKVTGKDAKTVTEILADIGVDFAGARDILAESKSEGSKAEREAVNKAFADDGIFGGLKSLGSNPQVIAETVVESVPEMLSLAGLVRVAAVNVFSKAVAAATSAGATREAAIIAGRQAVEQAAPRLATLSTVLEGAQSAGNQAAEYAAEGRLKERQALASLAGGAGVAAVGFGLNRVAPRLGLEDVETAMATGGLRGGRGGIIDRARGAVSGAARGALREGPLEEGAQSYLEQIAQNFGNERPLFEGTGQAAVEGMLAGTVLGAGGGGFAGARPDRAEQLARQLDQDIDATNWAPESDTRVAVDMLSPDRGVASQAPTSAAPPAVEPAPAPVAPMQPEATVPPSVTTTWVDDDGIPHPVQVVQADVPVEGDPRPHSLVSYAGTEVLVPSDQLQSAPRREINFTPADSPTAQAGLQPIIVPEVTPNVSRTDAPVPVPAGSSGLGGTDAIGSLGVAGRNDVGGRRLVDTGAEPGAAGASAVVGGGATPQPTPSVVEWTGRNGNGYATLEDAMRGLTRRQQLAPGYDWRVEPAGDRFKLVGERIEQAPVQTETEAAITAGPTEAGQAETLRDMGDLESAAARRATAQAALDRLADQGRIERISLGEPDPVLAQQVQDLGDTLTRAFGSDARVVPFASDDASAPQGMQLGNLLLIDTVTPQNPVANTTLHEFKHSIEAIAAADTRAGRKNTPAQRFTEQIHSLFDDMSEEGKRSYLENFLRRDELRGITDPVEREARIQELLGSDELRSEMTADFMGNRANDREWLADLARTDPEGFRGFVQKWIDLLDNLVKSLRGIKNQSRMESARVDQYVKDLNRAKMVARDALVEFRKSTAKPAGAREGAAAGTTTGRPGARPRSSVKDAWLNRRVGQPRFSTRQPMDGRAFTGFFSNITAGLTGRPGDRAFTPTLNVDGISEFVREYERHRGNFDDHIGTSIPTFRELQTIVGDAIVKSFDNADMLDVGASEGALVKTISKLSDGSIRTVALDPNPSMAAHFNSGERVPGSKYAVEAFGTRAEEGLEAWVEDDVLVDRDGSTRPNPYAGQQIRFYKPDRKFDVVHEAMVFQFINADRAQQVSRIKELMKPGGIVILEEKFIPGPGLSKSQFDANEAQKDAFKEQYFTREQIEAKARAVGVKDQEAYRKAQAEQESQVVGMADLMVAPAQLEKVLSDNFQHVVQFWDAGNFKGYMASDDRTNLENLLGNMEDVNSEFSNTQTPRWVGDGAPLMSRRQGATPAETTRRSDRNEQAAGLQPPQGDIYRNIEVRPGTTAEQKRLGRSAVRDFFNWLQRAAVRAGESPGSVSLLGASMYRGFVEGTPQSLIGSTISSSADLAALAQVYRDPRFETLRAFFVDADGNVILEQAASTRNPASINFGDEFYSDLTRAFNESGAEKFYLLHNHPSGSPAPSESDVRFTQLIADELGDAFASHVVIDHNSYAVIDRHGDYKVIDAPELVGIDFSTRPEAEHELLGTFVKSPKDIGMIGKRIAQADDPVLVVTKGGVYAEVGLITSVPMSFLELAKGPSSDRARFLAGLRRMTRVAGVGGRAFVVLPKSADSRQNYGWMHEAFAQDVINSDGVSVLNPANIRNKSVDDVTGVTMRGGRIATRTAQLREDSAAPAPTKADSRAVGRSDELTFSRRQQIAENFLPNRPGSPGNEDVRGYGAPVPTTVAGVGPARKYPMTDEFRQTVTDSGLTPVDMVELPMTQSAATRFEQAVQDSKAASRYGAAVYVYPVNEYRDMRLFQAEDGRSGFAIKPDGDIVSVYSDGGGKVHSMLVLAVEQGGTKLDAFDTVLPELYSINGFREVRREPWNDRYRPEGWDKNTFADFNNGEPDVVYMEYDANYIPDLGVTEQQETTRGDREGRVASRELAPLEGAPVIRGATGPDPEIVRVAETYARKAGIPYTRQTEYVDVNESRARRLADAYDRMEHAPNDPAVREAYENLIRQTTAQYRALEDAGYRFYFYDETNDPYDGNPWNAMRDLRANKVMGVFATEAGFGSGATELDVTDNPLLADTGITWPWGSLDGQPKRVLANDLFRAVHDAFGHGLEGAGFRARGEENAWQAHARLFTGSALGALTSETRGQNSWLNYGPYGEQNRTAKVEDTVFADQKTGLMPEWTWTEGLVGGVEQSPLRQAADRVIKDPIQRAAVESVLGGRVAEMSDTQLRDAVSRAAQDPAQRRVIAQTEAGRQLLDAATSTEPEQVPMFSARQPLGFYSELSRRVEDGPASAMKDQWKGYINGLKQKGVKPDEIEWSGVLDWLDMQTGKVSRDDVLNFLDNNGVQLEEVTSRSESGLILRYGPSQTEFGEWDVYDSDGDVISTFPTQEDAHRFATGGDFARKYDSYTVPGDSSNYREVLLKLPAPKEQVSPDFLNRVRREYLPNGLIGITLPSGLRHTARTDAEADAIIERVARNSKAMTHPGAYKSSHWDQPNVIAHVRTTDRVDVDGNQVLFVEEVQSDWAQEGRQKGFASDAPGYQVGDDVPGWGVIQAIRGEGGSREFDVGGLWVNESRLPAPASDRRAHAIPRAPFVTSTDKWVSLAIKRILTMAAEGGYDKVAFVNGEQAAEMFDLSNQISEVNYNPDDEWLTAYGHNGGRVFDEWVAPESLDDYVGKELADRIRRDAESNRAEQERERGEWSTELDEDPDTGEEFYILINSNGEPLYSNFGDLERFDTEADAREWIDENVATGMDDVNLSGLDLKVGGEGMKGFYDNIVPKVARDVLKKIGGGKIETVRIPIAAESTTEQVGFSITDAMREKVETTGLPMFSRRQTETPEFKAWFGDSKVVDAEGRPLVVYHGTKWDFAEFQLGRADRRDGGWFGDGFYLTASQDLASSYAMRERDHSLTYRPANVMPAYVRMENPFRINLAELSYNEGSNFTKKYGGNEGFRKWLADNGYDGVIGYRDPEIAGQGAEFWEVVVFDPAQIKSAIGNVGTFDPSNPDITMSRRQNALGQAGPHIDWTVGDTGLLDDFIYLFQDKHVDLKRVQQAITEGGKQIEDRWDAYLKEGLYHGRAADQTLRFMRDEIRPLMVEIKARGESIESLEEYLHNAHAISRNAQIRKINPDMQDAGSGITDEAAQTYLDNLPADRRNRLEALAKRIRDIVHKTQDVLVAGGLETQETIDTWRKVYPDYVPLEREDLDFGMGNALVPGSGQGYSVRGSSSKRATGSTRPVKNILANIALQRENAITRAEKNRVATALYGLAVQNPNTNFWLPVNPDMKFTNRGRASLASELVSMGLNPLDARGVIEEPKQQYIDPITGLVTQRVNPALRNSDNVIALRINGQDRYLFLNNRDPRAQRMAVALKNLDPSQMNLALRTSASITRWLASVNTQYNPIFGVVNFTRDIQAAALNLTTTELAGKQAQVMKAVPGALGAIYNDLRKDRGMKSRPNSEWNRLWREFSEIGAKTGYREQFRTSDERHNALFREMNNLHGSIPRRGFNAVFGWLSDYNEAGENAVRLAAYKVALDNGMSKERAAMLAKDLTVNFNRKGHVTQQMSALYAFFNASLQGTERTFRTLRGPAGAKIIAGGLLLGVLQALGLAMAGFGEDEPPEFVRERNIIIPIPGGDPKDYITIPMPLGFHVIPNTSRLLTEGWLRGWTDKGDLAMNLIGSVLDAFNPIGHAGWSWQTVFPTAVDPLIALLENRDWSGRPIYRESFSGRDVSPGTDRAMSTATWWSKEIAKYLNLASGGTEFTAGKFSPTPDQIDYLIGQATGGVGREASKAAQLVESIRTGESLPPYKVPLAGRFYGTTSGPAGPSSAFYSNLERMARHRAEIDGRVEQRRSTGEYFNQHPEARLAKEALVAENEVRKARRRMREAIERGDRERVREIEERIANVMTRFNEKVDARNGERSERRRMIREAVSR